MDNASNAAINALEFPQDNIGGQVAPRNPDFAALSDVPIGNSPELLPFSHLSREPRLVPLWVGLSGM